ncbi:hypothetical protein glysoja_009379, partial [Glycine soja]
IWSLSKDGFYSVKSAYTLAMDCFGNQKQYHVERNWMVIWRMNAPKKIKAMKNSFHYFLPVQQVYQCGIAGLCHCIEPYLTLVESFQEMIFKLSSTMDEDKFCNLAMLLWSLWEKKEVLWNSIEESIQFTCFRAQSMLYVWRLAHQTRLNLQDISIAALRNEVSWENPPIGFVKCNYDVANSSGFTCCLRDETGNFVLARTSWAETKLLPQEGKALSLLYVVKWVKQLPFQRIIFETNYKSVIYQIQS